jgi:hypothetical protein
MPGRELDQRVLGMDGPEAAQTGQETEDQVLGDEAPRGQADDGSDLAADDRPNKGPAKARIGRRTGAAPVRGGRTRAAVATRPAGAWREGSAASCRR